MKGFAMSKLGCPCGNTIWDGDDGAEHLYTFVSTKTLLAHKDDIGFFETMFSSDLGLEMWKCCVCDRLMAFDDPRGPVSRYFRRVDAEGINEEELGKKHIDGVCYNNLFFNDVEDFLIKNDELGYESHELYGGADYAPSRGPFFTPVLMKKVIFDRDDFRFRNWWHARLYDDMLVLYSPFMEDEDGFTKPVRAWRRYEETWSSD